VTYGFGELDTLVPAYAATIHKSQGSEYPAVIIPMLTQHHPMLQRNLLYTGLTRGKRLVILVGQKKAIAIAVRKVSGKRRWSNSTIGFGSARRARRSLRPSRVEARWRRGSCRSGRWFRGAQTTLARETRPGQDMPSVSAMRRSLIVANCLTRSAAMAGLS